MPSLEIFFERGRESQRPFASFKVDASTDALVVDGAPPAIGAPGVSLPAGAGQLRLELEIALPIVDHKPAPYNGPSKQEVLALRQQYLSPGLITYYRDQLLVVEGHMQYLWDETGKRYLDAFAGIVTVSVGHCHPYIVEKVREQVGKLLRRHGCLDRLSARELVTLHDVFERLRGAVMEVRRRDAQPEQRG